ncbi:MAG: hypothetical protein IR164_00305 [Devosia sp.]|jgi:hypothetical protein|uniref:hypothetical protein n=1 Tax=Devosia sp. TaxID=1871048 RepID=UPI0019E2E25A|nr:hypothetical protein [Devosia sp.]MBF0677360.1 hypothetical protein [Devosia sp.]
MAGPRGFPWLGYGIALVVILVFTLSPVIALVFAGPGPGGAPMTLTELMASWGVLGWLILSPFALGGMALLGWFAALAIHLLVWRRRRGKGRI